MAHGDYHCCAICDRKMGYDPDGATSKEDICVECREEHGIATVQQLIDMIEEGDPKVIDLPLRYCHYANPVDVAFYRATGREPPESSWSKIWLPPFKEDEL